MKLIDLVAYFRHGGTFEGFCREQELDAESEVIEIYAQVPVGLESQLRFFPIEETGGQVEVNFGGIKYENLFDFFFFLQTVGGFKDEGSVGDAALSETLLSYAMKDA